MVLICARSGRSSQWHWLRSRNRRQLFGSTRTHRPLLNWSGLFSCCVD